MDGNMTRKICSCNIPADLQRDKMYEAIAAYVESLSPSECVSDEEYERRLRICDGCDGRTGPTCRYCGCFVLARAKKREQECPMPGEKKW